MPIGFRIEPRASAPDPALIEALRGVSTSIISDNMGRLYAGGPELRPFHDGTPMIGMAITVRARPGDNLMIHKAIDLAQPGDVIVVDAGGDLTNSLVGEIMLNLAIRRAIAGYIIDGAVRDTGALAKASLGVFARGVSHRGPYKDGPGEINVPIVVGGQPVSPGDIVIGDADGILAVPQRDAAGVAELAKAQIQREESILASIADGTVDRSWVDATLKAKGLVL